MNNLYNFIEIVFIYFIGSVIIKKWLNLKKMVKFKNMVNFK